MINKNEKFYDYRIEFETVDKSDCGFEIVEASGIEEAIEIFRAYYAIEDYRITDIYRKLIASWNNK